MRCPKCDFENPDEARFCAGCGAKLEQACPACDAPVQRDQRFCQNCGHKLGAGAPAREVADSRLRSDARPDSYTPKHLAERILNSREALVGERKQVTVLFSDVKGSLYPDGLTEVAEELGGHYERGEVWAKAAAYNLLAAEKAKLQYAYEDASQFAHKALEAAEKAPGLEEERTKASVLLDSVAITPSNVFSLWLNINAALVLAAEESTRDASFAVDLKATEPAQLTDKAPADSLKRAVEFRNKLDLLRAKNDLEPTDVFVDPSGEEVIPAEVFANSEHVLDSLLDFIVVVFSKDELLIGEYYKDHGLSGKKPSDVFGLVDLANRRIDQLLKRLNQ